MKVEFIRDVQLEQELVARLRQKYLTEKPLPHLTELLYCLTRSYFDRTDPLEVTKKELLYFAVGFGLEAVLLRSEGDKDIESVEMDGIWLTLDYVDLQGVGVDLKSTRMWTTESGVPKNGWPETWLKQFMAYARVLGQTDYKVAVAYIGQPDLVGGVFRFSKEQVEENWQWVLERKEVYEDFIFKGEAPTPYEYNQSWECKNCKYALRCSAFSS